MGNPWTQAEHARHWLSGPRPGNPYSDEQWGVVLALCEAQRPRRILDLGCGPGDFDRRLLDRAPEASLVCLDASETMLERARHRLRDDESRVAFVRAEVEDDWTGQTGADFDAILALNVVHHLDGPAKRSVFARCRDGLRPGGLLVLSDRVTVDERWFGHYKALWNRARRTHDYEPLPADYGHDDHLEQNERAGDVPDRLRDQLEWMSNAGFDPVTCFWRHANRAVFGGLRG